MSLFAAAVGARRVYAVEASRTAGLIRQVARDNGYEDIITVLHSKVEDVQLLNGRLDVELVVCPSILFLNENKKK